jgi:DNA-binding NarL/FixJ family response regulator
MRVGLRCLIVDDNVQFLEAAVDLLRREGINVVGVASTASEGLHEARRLEPDISLVDIDLGGESGFDLAERLSAEPSLERSRVILISAYSAMDVADLVEASPAVGFLSKSELSGKAVRDALNGDLGR